MISLIQLEYIVAIDTWRHFATAAEKTFVTQPTLSMQIKKMEEDLGIVIFDRSKQPVIPTEAGKQIIAQARKILSEARKIPELVKEAKGIVAGELKIAIIPTLAPYLLPKFTGNFLRKYPDVKLQVHEMVTEDIVNALIQDKIDAGILVTPLKESGIEERPLFYEKLILYKGKNEKTGHIHFASIEDLTNTRFWLLSTGHCFRNQMVNLCKSPLLNKDPLPFQFESGSLETLIKLVDTEGGVTLLPELATTELSSSRQKQLIQFGKEPAYREVSLAFSRNYVKEKLLSVLTEAILSSIPETMKEPKKSQMIEWK